MNISKICEKYDTSNEHCYGAECHAKDKAIIVMLDKILQKLGEIISGYYTAFIH